MQLTKQNIKQHIYAIEPEFKKALSKYESKLAFEQESHFAMQLLEGNDYLMSVASNDQKSLFNAIVNVATIGLTLNPAHKLAYLVPRKGKICLDISYQGLMQLALETGSIRFIRSQVVYQNDTLKIQGMTKEPLFEFDPFEKDRNRKSKKGVFVCAYLSSGEVLTDIMSYAECLNIRDRSEAWKKKMSGPWLTDEDEMLKKTVIKRAYKLWPKVSEKFAEAVSIINEHEGIDFEEEQKEPEEKPVQNYSENSVLIGELTNQLARLTTGMKVNDKGLFMLNQLGIKTWSEINKKTTDQLKQDVQKLSEMKPEIVENTQPDNSTDKTDKMVGARERDFVDAIANNPRKGDLLKCYLFIKNKNPKISQDKINAILKMTDQEIDLLMEEIAASFHMKK